MKLRLIWAASVACLCFASFSIAATIKLKDGRTLVGEVKKLGNSYSILMSDGNRSLVPVADILSIDGKSLGPNGELQAPSPAAPTKTPTTPGAAATPPVASPTLKPDANSGAAFAALKSKADRSEQVIIGMQLWEKWVDANPSSPDIAAAKAELATWTGYYKNKAEKIKGKWVSGDELKQLKGRVKTLIDGAFTAVPRDGNMYIVAVDGVKGVKKLEEVLSIYPQSFQANFEMGYYHLRQIVRLEGSNELISKSATSLERAAKYRPDIAEVWANLAIVYNFRREYEKSVNAAWTACQKKDDPQIVAQLGIALYNTPRNFVRSNPRVSQIEREAQSLFAKYGEKAGDGNWLYLRPSYDDIASGENDPNRPAGLMGNGSGFFVTADGYLLTNRHVVTDEQQNVQPDVAFRIRMDDGTEKMAEVIAIDDKWDMALLKISVESPVPYFQLAATDPLVGSKALVLGYPANGAAGLYSMMVGEGMVKNVNKEDIYHVWYDINTTHGNSGGPMIDAEGNLISIISAGRTVEATSNKFTYVLGLGPDQIRDFLKRIGVKAPKVAWAPRTTPFPLFDAVTLTEKYRKSTLLVMSIRTTSSDVSAPKSKKAKTGAEDKGEENDEAGKEPKPDAGEDGAGKTDGGGEAAEPDGPKPSAGGGRQTRAGAGQGKPGR